MPYNFRIPPQSGALVNRPVADDTNQGLIWADPLGNTYLSWNGAWLQLAPPSLDATSILLNGTLASRPAASSTNNGSYYYATDTNQLFQSNGTTWTEYKPNSAVTITESQVTNLVSDLRPSPSVLTAAATLTGSPADIIADPTGIGPPLNLSAVVSGSGGTFTAGNYVWWVTAINAGAQESIALVGSPNFLGTAATAVATNGSVALSWTNPPGTSQNRIYRGSWVGSNTPPATPAVVATISAATTYTDTGTATSAGTPPATNNGAFTLTLPSATTWPGGELKIAAVSNTPNLVTLTPPSGTVDGVSSIALGSVYGADYRSVILVSDGSNWRVASAARPLITAVQSMGLAPGNTGWSTTGSAGALTASGTGSGQHTTLAVVRIPFVGIGQRFIARCSAQVQPATGFSAAIGAFFYLLLTDSTGATYRGNLAYWEHDAMSYQASEPVLFSASWGYYPRAGDYNLEGITTPQYLTFAAAGNAGPANVVSASLTVEAGAVGVSYTGAQ